ncbi:hypothetical protein [Streptomyces aurantiogriseus]|uniref:Lipoprotein n=1 Tax=Streptomyces aurantiogriseus TaxID=66870 RepID=A0A918BW32_9ACTN|nr:hypothetical protein [Streptomyces aurantiogriseus]GGQ91910.1 hypothetical protein GCM10010251_03100 [Streptomyces aurantiogriseus]
MTRRTLLASALSVAGLLTVASCATLGLEHPPTARQAAPTVQPSPGKPSAPTASPVLTDAQAHAALISDTDLGAPWSPTRGAATWRDGMLKATTPTADCQKLLDGLYSDELLGAPARAVVALDDLDTEAQLRYQLTDRRPADADRALAWLRTLPERCARFSANAPNDTVLDVTVAELPLPEVGDVRQGLRVTLTDWSTDGDGDPLSLALDVAAVRAGQDTFALVNGGLNDVPNEATQAAVQLGVQRLTEVRKQGRVQV